MRIPMELICLPLASVAKPPAPSESAPAIGDFARRGDDRRNGDGWRGKQARKSPQNLPRILLNEGEKRGFRGFDEELKTGVKLLKTAKLCVFSEKHAKNGV